MALISTRGGLDAHDAHSNDVQASRTALHAVTAAAHHTAVGKMAATNAYLNTR